MSKQLTEILNLQGGNASGRCTTVTKIRGLGQVLPHPPTGAVLADESAPFLPRFSGWSVR